MTSPSPWYGEAPAKVNLRLRVLEREAGGFHRLETVFQALTLVDGVNLTPSPEDRVVLELQGVRAGTLGPDEDNLAVRAARLFRRTLEEGDSLPPFVRAFPGVEIRLEKRIPHGAGLGGGSSDAATVLRGLNELAGLPLSQAELMGLGSDLGSDVPFFVSGAPRALGLGRGDRIVPLGPLPPRDVLLAIPDEPVSTKWAYETLDGYRRARPGVEEGSGGDEETGEEAAGEEAPVEEAGEVERRVAGGDWGAVTAAAVNDFEDALYPLRPELGRIKEALLAEGALPALLSGSGSAVFGVFDSEDALARAEDRLAAEGIPRLRTVRTRTR